MEHSYLDGWDPIGGLDLGRQYRNAPIVEAVIEFRVTPREDLVLAALSEINFGTKYEEGTPIYRTQAEFKLTPGESINVADLKHDSAGLAHWRKDRKRMIQVSSQHFAFIWTSKYSHWENFIAEVEAAWLIYREVSKPISVDSIGVRFVNVIPSPDDRAIEVNDYLRIGLNIPPALPQTMQSLFTQVDIPLPDDDASATITTAIVDPSEGLPAGGLLLDIDVKARVALSTLEDGFSGEIAGKLDRLRFTKNLVFEACITDATRGLIDHG